MRILGDFRGGGLLYWPSDDQRTSVDSLQMQDAVLFEPEEWMRFDGRRAHETVPFSGSRVSLVFYTVLGHEKMSRSTKDFLLAARIPLPSE